MCVTFLQKSDPSGREARQDYHSQARYRHLLPEYLAVLSICSVPSCSLNMLKEYFLLRHTWTPNKMMFHGYNLLSSLTEYCFNQPAIASAIIQFAITVFACIYLGYIWGSPSVDYFSRRVCRGRNLAQTPQYPIFAANCI